MQTVPRRKTFFPGNGFFVYLMRSRQPAAVWSLPRRRRPCCAARAARGGPEATPSPATARGGTGPAYPGGRGGAGILLRQRRFPATDLVRRETGAQRRGMALVLCFPPCCERCRLTPAQWGTCAAEIRCLPLFTAISPTFFLRLLSPFARRKASVLW